MSDASVPPRVSVTKTRTINLGNYQSEKISATYSRDLDPELQPAEQFHLVGQAVDSYLDEQETITLERRRLALSAASNDNSNQSYRISQPKA